MEDVAELVEPLLVVAFCCSQKTVHVNIDIGEWTAVVPGLLQGIGYGCAGQGWCEWSGGGCLVWGPGHGLAFQVMWCGWFVVPNAMLGYVGNGLHGSAKDGRQIFPAHRQCRWEGHKFWFMWQVWDSNPKFWDIQGVEADSIETIC